MCVECVCGVCMVCVWCVCVGGGGETSLIKLLCALWALDSEIKLKICFVLLFYVMIMAATKSVLTLLANKH